MSPQNNPTKRSAAATIPAYLLPNLLRDELLAFTNHSGSPVILCLLDGSSTLHRVDSRVADTTMCGRGRPARLDNMDRAPLSLCHGCFSPIIGGAREFKAAYKAKVAS